MLRSFVPLVVGVLTIRAAILPPYITPCSRNDPRLDECYFQRARETIPHILKGDPNYGIPPLDPLLLEKVYLDVGYGLVVNMTNVVIRGFNNIILDDITHDMKNFSGYLEMTVPKFTVTTDYEVDGNIFTLPIKGSGKGRFTITDVKLYMRTPYTLEKQSNGKQFLHLYNTTVDFGMSRLHIKLDNLFSGNKFLDESMNLVLNENWKELIKGAKPLLLDGLHSLLTHTIDTLLTEVDWDEVLPKEGIWI